MTAQSKNQSVAEDHRLDSTADKMWLWLFLIALAVRLPFVFIAPNNGTDALARFHYALAWLKDPARLPDATTTDAWLPLHIWLLGAVLWLWNSERSARLLTAFLGAATILPYWGTLRRAFDLRGTLASTLLFALYGFHVAYSVTTSSETPTLFFLTSGVYFWMRFLLDARWAWCVPAAIALSAASLCRFDAWVFMPVLSVLLLDFSRGWASVWSNRSAWLRATCFGLTASAGAVGWMVFSYVRWADPMELPHRTIRLIHSLSPVLRHSLPFRLVVVPVSLLTSLSPLIVVLAALGIFWVLGRGERAAKSLAVLALTLFAWNYANSVKNETTQARYILMYSWLLIPFAFEGLRRLARLRPRWGGRRVYVGTVVFFLVWEAGIVFGGHYGPEVIADRLSPMSPTLEPHVEIRRLTQWLRGHTGSTDTVVFDEFSFQSDTILQLSGINLSRVFQVRGPAYSSREVLGKEVQKFIRSRHPRFAVCSPYGPIGDLWSLDDREDVDLPALGISLQLEWQAAHWRVYTISYSQSPSQTVRSE
ncbi:MAG TPA: glycosyltransferase family 39 protein [Terriglobia bacterium]|nr:glycosyltransferase family 39 protein [Terriglobia bacterium]